MVTAQQQPEMLERYLRGYWLYQTRLRRSQWESPEQVRDRQLHRLRLLLAEASRHVPYYRALFQKLGATPDDFRDLSDLARLPVLQKQTVREHFNDFVNPRFTGRDVFTDHTSGSTGEPFRFLLTAEQKALEMACHIRFYRWAGYRTGARIAAFRHHIPQTERDPLWRHDKKTHTLFFSVYDMTPANLRAYLTEFNNFRPQFVRGYPSSIFAFARFAAAEGLTVHAPRAVLCSSETLSPEMRTLIEQTLRCPVFDWWGANERLVTACQCEQRNLYHVNAEAGILELVPEAGMFRLVGTGLVNRAMPLIRYDFGDFAEPATEPCPCGRGLPCIRRILGRADDLIVTGDGKQIPPVRFYTLFETWQQIRQFQIVQTAPDAVTVRLVPSHDLNPAEREQLLATLRRFLGIRISIELETVERIAPEPSGKTRNVISLVKR